MKISNKAILISTVLAALFASQTAMANPEGSHDEYNTIHSSPASIDESNLMVNNTKKQKVNYSLINCTKDCTKEKLSNSDIFIDHSR